MENYTTKSYFSSSFHAFGFASEFEAEGPAALSHRDCARPEGLRIPLPLAAGALATRRNGWDKTADMRSISWLFRTSGFASELEAERPAALHRRDCARPEGLRIPVPLAAGPLQQGGTAGTKRLICGAYHGFSTPPALQASLKPKAQKKAAFQRNAAVFFVAERSGFEPEIRFCRIHAFQACLLSHSSISPEWECKYTESFYIFATLKNCFDFFAGFSLEHRRFST